MARFVAIIAIFYFQDFILRASTSLPPSSPKKYRKVILESSNNPNFTIASAFPETDEDTNSTWKYGGFSMKNISFLLKSHPSSFVLQPATSTPSHFSLCNSSRLFYSSNESSVLTIVIKQLKQPIMYLNFSYYINKTEKNKVPETEVVSVSKPSLNTNNSHLSVEANVSKVDQGLSKEKLENKTINQLAKPKFSESVPSLNDSEPNSTTVPPLVRSVSTTTSRNSTSGKGESEPIPIIHDMARQRRSIPENSEEPPSNKNAEQKIEQNPAKGNNSKIDTSNSSSTIARDRDKHVSIDEALEMIKTAAEAIESSKKKVPSSQASSSISPTGHPDSTESEEAPAKVRGNRSKSTTPTQVKESGPATPASAEKRPGKMVLKHVDNLKDTGQTDPGNRHHHHHRRKPKSSEEDHDHADDVGKNGNKGNNVKNKGKKTRKGSKNDKTGDSTERISSGKTNDDNDEKSDEDSSSSEEIEHLGGKKKISYKTWKASFEKRNRPPGLYVMINEDIIFDNWEGLWDKHYVLGRWTGSNNKPLGVGMWNHTHLFMNWEEVPVNDIKITFEWEPMDENSYLVLTDIVASTIGMPSLCDSPNKSNTDLKTDKNATTPAEHGAPARTSPIIIIKQNNEDSDNEAWQIIKLGNAGSTQVDNVSYTDLNKNQMDNSTQTKLIGKDANDDLLKAVLDALHGQSRERIGTTTPAATSTEETSSVSIPSTSTTPVPSRTMGTTPTTTTTTTPTTPLMSTSSTTPPSTTMTPTTTTTTTITFISAPSNANVKPINPPSGPNPVSRHRKEDRESALLVSIITGSIAIAILVLTLKTYLQGTQKDRN